MQPGIQSIWKKVKPNCYELLGNQCKMLLSQIRDKNCSQNEFIMKSRRILNLLLESSLGELETVEEERISGTGVKYSHLRLKNPKICLVPILRSGEALSEVGRLLTEDVAIASILIQRDESKEEKPAILYYKKIPKDITDRQIIILDPMLATGGSVCTALQELEKEGVDPNQAIFVNLVSCPDGLDKLGNNFPGLRIFTASMDPILNDVKYIEPGLGDFGDRYYGTN